MKKITVSMFILFSISGCATIIDGTSQEVMVNTNPAGASCTLERENKVIGKISPTPASATVKKTKHDITIRCDKEGYQQNVYMNKSGNAGATAGNILLGGPIAWGVDSAVGADNKYESPVNITLVPVQPAPVASPGIAPIGGLAAPLAAPAPIAAPTTR